MRALPFLFLGITLFLVSCQEVVLIDKVITKANEQSKNQQQEKKSKPPIKDGKVVIQNEGSNTSSEIEFKDGQKNGIAWQYYSDGKIWKESPYKDGKLHGVARVYDKEGRLEREVSYHTGLKHGEYIRYFKSGKPQLKLTYNFDLPQPGIQEINYKAEPVSAPVITVEEDNQLRENGSYHYYFSLAPGSKNARYYILQSQDEWQGTNVQLRNALLPSENGTGHFEVSVEKGYTINTEVYIYATYPVAAGVDAAVMKKLQVRVRN